MIDPEDDDDEYGEATGSPCDRVVSILAGGVSIGLLIYIARLLTKSS